MGVGFSAKSWDRVVLALLDAQIRAKQEFGAGQLVADSKEAAVLQATLHLGQSPKTQDLLKQAFRFYHKGAGRDDVSSDEKNRITKEEVRACINDVMHAARRVCLPYIIEKIKLAIAGPLIQAVPPGERPDFKLIEPELRADLSMSMDVLVGRADGSAKQIYAVLGRIHKDAEQAARESFERMYMLDCLDQSLGVKVLAAMIVEYIQPSEGPTEKSFCLNFFAGLHEVINLSQFIGQAISSWISRLGPQE